jgi:HAMP domain-containing protein/PAS domain-containing protein
MRLNVRSKMLIFILSAFLIIICISTGYSVITFLKNSKNNLIKEATSKAKLASNKINTEFDYYMDLSRTLSQVFLDYKTIPENLRRPIYLKLLQDYLEENKDVICAWTIWEPNSIDNLDNEYIGAPGCTTIGNFYPSYFRHNDIIQLEINPSIDSENHFFQADYYTVPKNTAAETIMEPYLYSYTGETKDQIYQTNMIVPLFENGQFLGVVGVDIALSDVQNLINDIKFYDESEIILLSNTGNIIAKNLAYTSDTFNLQIDDSIYDITQKINTEKSFSYFNYTDSTNKEYFCTIIPFTIGKSVAPWALVMKVPTKILFAKSNKLVSFTILISLIGLFILTIIIYFIANNIIIPLRKTNLLINSLSKGKLNESELIKSKNTDEIGEMAVSANTLFKGLSQSSTFATEIGKNNLNVEFSLLSNKDVLGKSLLKMKESLKHADIERIKRKDEEEILRWHTNGIAKFGELLRSNNEINELANTIIENLLAYVNSVQGSLFMLNTNDPNEKIYELVAAIAFERDKLIEKHFEIGEGLVGRCANEKKTILLQDTPVNFVEITSGLNQENPTNFLLVPLKINEDVFGVIELVSFNHFEKHQIDFVEKIGENIAATLNNLKINNQTLELLEQAQQQKEELTAHEEEMRQNMEEMQTTQEESAKNEIEIKATIKAINDICFITEFNLNKRLLFINNESLKKLGMTQSQIVNKDIDLLSYYKETNLEADDFWEVLLTGMTFERNSVIKFKDKNINVVEHFSPVYDEDGEVFKILNIGFYINN